LDLKNETLNVLKNFEEQIKKKKLTVKTEIWDNILVQANKNYFYIFLSNIIWNAIKYNKNEGSIDINFTDWELSIKDSGIWIKKEELWKIFDRFYKTDISRNSSGYGIWLSLVKKIASIYNWQIDMESEEWNWSNFKIKF
jgi:two-component system phosphate regulon sensor histidine kinase PhoR